MIDVKDALTHKYGPLPGYAWAGLGAIAIVIVAKRAKGSSAAAPSFMTMPPQSPISGFGDGLGAGGGAGDAPVDPAVGYGEPIIGDPFSTASPLDTTAPSSDPAAFTPDPTSAPVAAAPVYDQPATWTATPSGAFFTGGYTDAGQAIVSQDQSSSPINASVSPDAFVLSSTTLRPTAGVAIASFDDPISPHNAFATLASNIDAAAAPAPAVVSAPTASTITPDQLIPGGHALAV